MTSNSKFLVLALVIIIIIAAYQKIPKPYSPLSPSPTATPEILTEEEKFILNPPPKDASKSAIEKHAQTVAKLAKESSVLEINGCQAKPLVLKTKIGSEIEIKNVDKSETHTIIIDRDHYYTLSPNSSKVIKAQFRYGSGDYGYVCDGMEIVGFLHITP